MNGKRDPRAIRHNFYPVAQSIQLHTVSNSGILRHMEIARALDSTLWVPLFLDELRRTGVQSVAARAAGVSVSVVVARRRISPGFDAACVEAMAESVDELEHEARQRARNGSDKLLLEVLRAERPEKYKRPEVAGAGVVSVTVNTAEFLERVRAKCAEVGSGVTAREDGALVIDTEAKVVG